MNNKIIKLKIFQEKTVFRTPYSMEVIETYPLPPYSTILGFIHNMLSEKDTIKDINISVQGNYGNVVREFVRYHKYEKGKKEGDFYPIVVTSLIDLELLIHIKMPTEALHNKFLHSLKNPPYFPYLGRPEDIITEIKAQEDEERELDPSILPEGVIEIPYNCYIPVQKAEELEIATNPIIYLVPGYYKLKSGNKKSKEVFRNFEMIKVFYVQAGEKIEKSIKVDSEGIPLWWMK